MGEIKAVSIEADNFLWAIVMLYASFRVIIWKTRNHLSWYSDQVVTAWTWMFLASGINHGWFAVARHFKTGGSHWNASMFEWRWLMVIITSLMFFWGMMNFLQLIDEFSDQTKYGMMGLFYIISRLMGFY